MRITKDIVEQAKRLLQSWEKASKDVGVEKDKDYQIREIANLLGVKHQTLKKKL